MRRLLAEVVVLFLATASLSLLVRVSTSYADTVCQVTDPETGMCIVTVEVPSSTPTPGSGPKDTGTGSACYWDGTKQGVTNPPPGPVPCTSTAGYWSNSYHCYVRVLSPQPPAGDPSWAGHQPGDGVVYNCYQPETDLLIYIWAQNPPPNSGAGATLRDVAQLAINQMDLKAINIGITPKPGADSIGLVGMPVWLWASSPDAHTWGPATASATAGGITVTATARVDEITWDMGDGNKVTCTNAGTPYKALYGDTKSPDCGYVYMKSSSNQPGGTYTVTATSDWVIAWSGAGQTGTVRLNGLTRSVQIAVGEAQVLVQ